MFLKCDGSSGYMRVYIVKRKKLFYYKCDNKKRCSCNKSAKDLHKKFEGILGEITLDEKYIPIFKLQMQTIYTEINENRDKVNEQFQKKVE